MSRTDLEFLFLYHPTISRFDWTQHNLEKVREWWYIVLCCCCWENMINMKRKASDEFGEASERSRASDKSTFSRDTADVWPFEQKPGWRFIRFEFWVSLVSPSTHLDAFWGFPALPHFQLCHVKVILGLFVGATEWLFQIPPYLDDNDRGVVIPIIFAMALSIMNADRCSRAFKYFVHAHSVSLPLDDWMHHHPISFCDFQLSFSSEWMFQHRQINAAKS